MALRWKENLKLSRKESPKSIQNSFQSLSPRCSKLKWPSMTARVLILKVGYFCHVLSPDVDHVTKRALYTLAPQVSQEIHAALN